MPPSPRGCDLTRGIVPILWLTCALCAPVWAAPAPSAFADGVAAFRGGRYHEALQFFLLAQSLGQTTAQLLHNLGVTHYRLGDYQQAGAAFQALAVYPDAAPLARYNLGLVALKLGRTPQARAQFEQASRTATRPELRALADQQLQRLAGPAPASRTPVQPPPPSSVASTPAAAVYLHFASGYEDNVALASETSLILPAQRASWYSQFLAGGHIPLTGDRRNGWRLAGAAFRVAYPEATRYGVDSLRFGPQYRSRHGDLQTETSLSGIYVRLGGQHFGTVARAGVRADYLVSAAQTLTGLYQYEHIEGGADFAELDGWRQSLRLSDAWDFGPVDLTLGYRLELNRRRDFRTSTQFTSTSSTRHRGFADAGWRFSPAWRTDLQFEFEQSRFNDPDQFTDASGSPVSLRRFDQRTFAQGGLSWTPGRNWELTAEYRLLIRQSNDESFEYLSNRYELRLEHRF